MPPQRTMPPAARARRFVPLIAIWLAFVSLPPLGLLAARERLLAWQSSPTSQVEWDTFREAMQAESRGRGPVKRKVPKSPEPPLKVWLRDYFPLAIAAWVLFGSVLFFVTGFLIIGAAATTPSPADHPRPALPPKNQRSRDRDGEKQHDGNTEDTE